MCRVLVRSDRAEDGNFGDGEPVGVGVFEMRIHFWPSFQSAQPAALN